jgi:hypothetical protein
MPTFKMSPALKKIYSPNKEGNISNDPGKSSSPFSLNPTSLPQFPLVNQPLLQQNPNSSINSSIQFLDALEAQAPQSVTFGKNSMVSNISISHTSKPREVQEALTIETPKTPQQV